MKRNQLIMISCIGFLLSFGTSLSETLVTKYVSVLGAEPSMIGLVGSVCSITALISLPLFTPFMDSVSKKYIYCISALFLFAAYIGFGLTTSVHVIVILRLLNGLGKGVVNAVCIAMVSDLSTPETATKNIIQVSLWMAISVAIAPASGVWLADQLSYQAAFLIGGMCVLCSILLAMRLQLPYTKKKVSFAIKSMFTPASLKPAFLMFLLSTSYSTINSFILVFGQEQGITNISLYFTVYSVALLVSRKITNHLNRYYDALTIIIPALFCFTVSLLLVSISTSLWMIILSAVISAFGYGVCQPIIQALCIQYAGEGKSGVGSSTSFVGTNFGYFFGPLFGGYLAGWFSYRTMYRFAMIPVMIGLIFVIKMRREANEAVSER